MHVTYKSVFFRQGPWKLHGR